MDIIKLTTDEQHFQRFSQLVSERIGMTFAGDRQDELMQNIRAASKKQGGGDLVVYYDHLVANDTGTPIWEYLVDLLTVGETYFFRNKVHFAMLRDEILPELISRRTASRQMRLWCAGCSTGEEPYSVAILLHELIGNLDGWNIKIFGTDINHQSLRTARKGIYRDWSFRKTPAEFRSRYFSRTEGMMNKLDPGIRRMVKFSYLNMVRDDYPSARRDIHSMDIILWRNMAIYFPGEVIQQITGKLHRCLVQNGMLIVGANEMNNLYYQQFTARNHFRITVYYKSSERPQKEFLADNSPTPLTFEKMAKKKKWKPSPPAPQVRAETPANLKHVEPEPTLPAVKRGDALEMYQEGEALQEKGRDEEALALFEAAMRKSPDLPGPYYQAARIYANRRQLEKALEICQKSVEHDPLHVEAQYMLGKIYQEMGEMDQAVGQFKKTLYLSPHFLLSHVSLALLYQEKGRMEDAVRHKSQAFRLALKLPPDEFIEGSDDLTPAELLKMIGSVA